MSSASKVLACCLAAILAACAGPAGSPRHTYNGSASVGDFLTITVDREASTLSWDNLTTGASGSTGFTIDADGSLVASDPEAEIQRAFEIPGYAIVAQDHKAKDGAQKALVFGFEKQNARKSDWANLSLNMLQFRTWGGGLEVGCGSVDASGTLNVSRYMPFASLNATPEDPYGGAKELPGSVWSEDPALGVLKGPTKPGEPASILFLTSAGFFGLDAPGGSVFFMKNAARSAFEPARAGTYVLIGFEKRDEALDASGPGDANFGTASFFQDSLTVSAGGALSSASGIAATLSPFKGSAFHGEGRVNRDCNGLFTFADPELGEVFAGFWGDTLVFATYKQLTDTVKEGESTVLGTYKYSYGIGLRR